jgi:hypothetical protein
VPLKLSGRPNQRRAADLLRGQEAPRGQEGPGSAIRRDHPAARPAGGHLRPRARPGALPPQGADKTAPQTGMRALRDRHHGDSPPGHRPQRTRGTGTGPARVGRPHGKNAAQDPHRLRSLPRLEPREPRRTRGIIRQRPSLMPLTCDYVFRGRIWGRRRPLCVRGPRVPGPLKSTDGHGRRGRSGHADRPAWFIASDLPLQDACAGSPPKGARRQRHDREVRVLEGPPLSGASGQVAQVVGTHRAGFGSWPAGPWCSTSPRSPPGGSPPTGRVRRLPGGDRV